jgi:ABC-type transport system involved in cytochrome c biogenesis permease subunit
MSQRVSFYMFMVAFILVALLTVYLIVDNGWYNSVNPFVLVFMYVGIAVVSFGMREEMLRRFEK